MFTPSIAHFFTSPRESSNANPPGDASSSRPPDYHFSETAKEVAARRIASGEIDTSGPHGFTTMTYDRVEALVLWRPESGEYPEEAKTFLREYLRRVHEINPSTLYQLGSCFSDRVHKRTTHAPAYPSASYDSSGRMSVPIVFLDDAIGAATEGLGITIGLGMGFLTNLRVENADLENGTNSFSRMQGHRVCDINNPGTLYLMPSRYPSVGEHHTQLRAAKLAIASRPVSELNDDGTRFQHRNRVTGELGRSLTLDQGRKPGTGTAAGNNNRRQGVPEELFDSGYVDGIQILVDEDLVTVDEILSAFSLTTRRGKPGCWGPLTTRKSAKTWNNLMKERGLKGQGREGTQQLNGPRFTRVQALVLERFG